MTATSAETGGDMDGPPLCQAQVHNTFEYKLNTRNGEYLIQVSWPLDWNIRGDPGGEESPTIPILYVLDGNAYFFSATDVARRLDSRFGKEVLVVGVGYPISHSVFDLRRRALDLTPPAKARSTAAPSQEASPAPRSEVGGAKRFLAALKMEIIPHVEHRLLSHHKGRFRRALFGHSFGGLFTLYTLFTETRLFDVYLAASPSIWYNDCNLVQDYEKLFLSRNNVFDHDQMRPCLFMTYGSLEQFPQQHLHESDEDFQRRWNAASQRKMKGNALEMNNSLLASKKLEMLQCYELSDEDHGGAAVCGLQRGIQWLVAGFTQ